jgi:hypothetical protein
MIPIFQSCIFRTLCTLGTTFGGEAIISKEKKI